MSRLRWSCLVVSSLFASCSHSDTAPIIDAASEASQPVLVDGPVGGDLGHDAPAPDDGASESGGAAHADATVDGGNATVDLAVDGIPGTVLDLGQEAGASGIDGAPMFSTCGAALAGEPLGLNNAARAIAVGSDGTTYLGGTFTYAGPVAGAAVPFDVKTGQPRASFAKVSGSVYSIIPDGQGGWFLGGSFALVGGLPRGNLAHLKSEGTVDANWSVDADATVRTLALAGEALYVGGDFTTLGGEARASLAAVDVHGVVSSWNPGVALDNPSGLQPSPIRALLAVGDTLYVGGDFNQIAGQERRNLASFKLDGTLTDWDPRASFESSGEWGSVRSLAVRGSTLLVGGSFETVSGVAHRALAAFDATGQVTDWDPRFGTNAIVETMAVGAGVLYVGGYFAGTDQGLRNQVAAFDESGNLAEWNPQLSPRRGPSDAVQEIYALSVIGDAIYVGGSFQQAGGEGRSYLAAVDPAGKVLPWNPAADGTVYALASDGTTLYVGGQLRTMCGQPRNRLAAIDAHGKLTDWNPGASGYVSALAVGRDAIYVGGGFSQVGGQRRSKLAAVAFDGAVTSWDPSLYTYGWVDALAVDGDTIYVGGDFSSVAGQTRNSLAAIDASGTLLPWLPQGAFGPLCMVLVGHTLYVGGTNGLVAIDSDGNTLPWNPKPDDYVYALATDGTTLYAGGYFLSMGGQIRHHVAAFDGDGNLLPWAPNVADDPEGVTSIAVLGDTIFLGGEFSVVEGLPRTGLAAIARDGTLLPWAPKLDGTPMSLAASNGSILVSGWLSSVDSRVVGNFARLSP